MDAKSATRLSAIVIFLSPVSLLALSPTLPVDSPSSQQTVSNQERENGKVLFARWQIEANRGKCRDVAKSFLRPVRKPFSFSVQSCFCQICYQMNPHMTRLSFWLMFISTLFLYFTRFTCGWHSACTCRTDLHFSKATQHLSSYTSPCSWWTRLTRFWSQHLPHFRCFCRTRWLLPPTCSWRSTGETIGWGHQTTCLRSTGHLDFHIWVGTRPGVSQMFAVIN